MGTIKILLAEDHAVVRQGTRELLEQQDDLEVVAEACDGSEAVRLALKERPDVVIMDFVMPKLNGIEATRQIKAIAPGIAILVLTAYDSDQYVFAFLEAGAAGYLLKDISVDKLIEAIRAIYAGESVLHPAITRKVIDRFARPEEKPSTKNGMECITERELEVLGLAARGMSNRDIARELHDDTIPSLIALSRRMEALATHDEILPETAIPRIQELREAKWIQHLVEERG